MIASVKKILSRYKNFCKQKLLITTPELLLLLVVIALAVTAVSASMKSNKGTSSTRDLKNYLLGLQLRFRNPLAIDAEKERTALELLLNRLKTSSPQKTISEDEDLKELFGSTCSRIKEITNSREEGARTSWRKLKNVVFDFQEFYYPKGVLAVL
jgi:hypothetical protein